MPDSISLVHCFGNELSDQQHEECCFPFRVTRKINEAGEVNAQFYDWEPIFSPLTGAKFNVRAIPGDQNLRGRIAGYEMSLNVPACLIGRNHLLVNGVPRAAEGALELLRNYAAQRHCTPLGLEQFRLDRIRLTGVTPTFLFEFPTPEQAQEKLREIRSHAEGILNHQQKPPGARQKNGRPPCFPVGPDHCFTLYVKQREFTISAYIKQANVPGAFATFPDEEVEQVLVELAQRTVRVEVEAHGKWLASHGLNDPEVWRSNPAAYEKVFSTVRETLRLDENLNVRSPKEAVIAKLPADHQTILRAHLAGKNVREHPLLRIGKGADRQAIDAQNKKFSAFKRSCLTIGVDLSIPWEIQSTKLSANLRDWLTYPGEYEPSADIEAHVFSRASTAAVIENLKTRTQALMGDG